MRRLSKIERVCQFRECGQTFFVLPYVVKSGYGKFCSRKCYFASRPSKVEKICQACGKTFFVGSSIARDGEGKYCSNECYDASRAARVERICQFKDCGKSFFIPPCWTRNGNGKYCSKKCYLATRPSKVEIICQLDSCRNIFSVWPSDVEKGRRKFCSRACAIMGTKKARSGSNSSHWKAGDDIPYTRAHQRVKALWGPASGYQCIECGRQARDWAYDGTDPGELYKQAHGKSKSFCHYSIWPEFYMPMCSRCHHGRDRKLWSEQLLAIRVLMHETGLTMEEIKVKVTA